MPRYVVDCATVLALTQDPDYAIPEGVELLAPTLLRSQSLSALHEAAERGELPRDEALEQARRVGRLRIRLLGDAVLRRKAWDLAGQLGWTSTYDAEYVALTVLQADALVTLDPEVAAGARTVVEVAPIERLRQRP